MCPVGALETVGSGAEGTVVSAGAVCGGVGSFCIVCGVVVLSVTGGVVVVVVNTYAERPTCAFIRFVGFVV